ncbi:hypothetical protein CCR94_16430 [Rhodoblastus sphagnicola]|uniref:Uncharacterized protein n=1 Tax=Rhodoblastus sphagnicola TaxID=333368 RepID=A0A2S6N308_9HYPH|nr:hypothetical protein [Rhodoblastus sphagnicola]MBB4199084.1 hypothetical protein [Rhodoblastus sphagnicola]PPQ28977.1 hypothetical protein CCR94_16430 [Rhodoblastus sphagnicola]
MVEFATADRIARAVVAAARLTGADPLTLYEVRTGASSPMARARTIAFVALREALPDLRVVAIERMLGLARGSASNVQKYRASASWWREDWVDEVVGAIVASEIEAAEAEAPLDAAPLVSAAPAPSVQQPAPQPETPAALASHMPRTVLSAVRGFAAAGQGAVFIARECALPVELVREILRSAPVKYRPEPKPRRSGHALPMGEPPAGRSALDERRAQARAEPAGVVKRGGVSLPRLSFLDKGA